MRNGNSASALSMAGGKFSFIKQESLKHKMESQNNDKYPLHTLSLSLHVNGFMKEVGLLPIHIFNVTSQNKNEKTKPLKYFKPNQEIFY